MPPDRTTLELFALLVIARMEVERINYIENHSHVPDRLIGFADAIDYVTTDLHSIIGEISV